MPLPGVNIASLGRDASRLGAGPGPDLPAGSCIVYRGQDGNIDYANIIAVMAADDDEVIIPDQNLPPNTNWWYIRRAVSDCGLQSEDSVPCVIYIDADGNMRGAVPNVPQCVIVEQVVGGKLRVRWYYDSIGQEVFPTGFYIFIDSGAGFDFDSPDATAAAHGQGQYSYTTDALVHGQRYEFAVKSYRTGGGQSNSSGVVAAVADAVGPAAITGLYAEVVS